MEKVKHFNSILFFGEGDEGFNDAYLGQGWIYLIFLVVLGIHISHYTLKNIEKEKFAERFKLPVSLTGLWILFTSIMSFFLFENVTKSKYGFRIIPDQIIFGEIYPRPPILWIVMGFIFSIMPFVLLIAARFWKLKQLEKGEFIDTHDVVKRLGFRIVFLLPIIIALAYMEIPGGAIQSVVLLVSVILFIYSIGSLIFEFIVSTAVSQNSR